MPIAIRLQTLNKEARYDQGDGFFAWVGSIRCVAQIGPSSKGQRRVRVIETQVAADWPRSNLPRVT
jgi:hypothetical protein